MASEDTDVVVVGAGPFGLSVAAHLRARRVEHRVFGPPMQFWLDMPPTINLKSYAFATNVYVPQKGYGYAAWCRANGLEDFEPCSMESFAQYGLWVARELVPDVDPTQVARVDAGGDGRFEVELADGRRLRARRVVCATGLSGLAYVPEVVAQLPRGLLSHTSEHRDYGVFRGQDVAVIGGGASAIEAGVLIHEAGGRPQVLVRDEVAHFGTRFRPNRSLAQRIRHPNSVLGIGLSGRLMQSIPFGMRLVPERRRVRYVKGSLGPSAPWWIATRVWGRVPIFIQSQVVAAWEVGSKVRLRIAEGGHGERDVDFDHVIAGTGFASDVDRVGYLAPGIRQRLRRVEAAPWLTLNFESSLNSLYFVGPIAAFSFGPLFRFVAGAEWAAPVVAKHVAAGGLRRAFAALQKIAY